LLASGWVERRRLRLRPGPGGPTGIEGSLALRQHGQIEVLTVDARIVIASVDTYLRFAEAVNRLDIVHDSTSQGLPELLKSVPETVAKSKVKGLAAGVKETIKGD
jgi:hypothetical protein